MMELLRRRGWALVPLLAVLFFQPAAVRGYYNWMYLGMLGSVHRGPQMSSDQPYSATPEDHARSICAALPGLVARQIEVCQTHPNAIPSVSNGARKGIQECQWQFRNERWNCTTSTEREHNVFRYTLQRGSKETAFVYAVTSAGVVHAVTQACSSGNLTECTCDLSSEGRSTPQGWKWGGCSDDVRFGINFARQFVDAPERAKKDHDSRKLMNLHNNEAGRLAVRALMKMQCRCHGVSGSCELKTCWRTMPSFNHIGDFLKKRYRRSVEVASKRQRLRRKRRRYRDRRSQRGPRRRELVYLDQSPNYCLHNPKMGILGTRGRECSKNSNGPDSCDLLCCGRGYNTEVVRRAERCHCKFVWCCKVHCKTCITMEDTHTCK
ncbi:protein Wnt-16-like [Amphibalanus amphitrite]|uniref:protein Wnt-16-like n=1 Tax=Amphibalanus amphitrite TaxID=1232801 RepID=UPI001C90CE1F|nr:protein Wnt-16-like [Amphibalanus amphitrite]